MNLIAKILTAKIPQPLLVNSTFTYFINGVKNQTVERIGVVIIDSHLNSNKTIVVLKVEVKDLEKFMVYPEFYGDFDSFQVGRVDLSTGIRNAYGSLFRKYITIPQIMVDVVNAEELKVNFI